MTAEAQVLWDVVDEHLDEAGWQWGRWEAALRSSRLGVAEVVRGVEDVLLAHIDGLTLAGRAAVDGLLAPALREQEPPLVAAAAYALAAIPGGAQAVWEEIASAEPRARAAMSRALALAPDPGVVREAARLAASADPGVRAGAALEVLAARGVDPGRSASRLTESPDVAVATAALRASAFAAAPPRAAIERAYADPRPSVRDAAIEVGLAVGFRSALLAARAVAEAGGSEPRFALAALAIGGDREDGARLGRAVAVPGLRADAIRAIGYAGWPGAVEAVLEWLPDPDLGPLAAEAIAGVSGMRIEGELASATPPTDRAAPDDDPDGDLLPGEDGEPPAPDPGAVLARWRDVAGGFAPDLRYVAGRPFAPESLLAAFLSAPMRRRSVLALELAVRSRGEYRVDTRGWALEQMRQQARTAFRPRPEALQPFGRFLLT